MSPRPRDDERFAAPEIAVVGTGFGGLSAAAYLADAGADVTVSASVSDCRERFNAPRGSALALSHTLGQTGPLRPAHREPGVEGPYYVGTYTTPGVGMPMCLLSGEHVSDAVIEDAPGDGMLPSVVSTSTLR